MAKNPLIGGFLFSVIRGQGLKKLSSSHPRPLSQREYSGPDPNYDRIIREVK